MYKSGGALGVQKLNSATRSFRDSTKPQERDSSFGLLSIGASTPHRFTTEHLCLAKSMAAPAAAAIYNVRLYERSEILASELEAYIKELKETPKQLERGRGREASQS
jgi:GAF domain-containing protein